MTPVFQTGMDLQAGDCLAACAASLLDLPLSAVPNFAVADEDWWHPSFCGWAEERGLLVQCASLPGEAKRLPPPGTLCIVGGQSPRLQALHAVVMERTEAGWRLVHDPHPSGAGIVGDPVDAEWFVPRSTFPGYRWWGPQMRDPESVVAPPGFADRVMERIRAEGSP